MTLKGSFSPWSAYTLSHTDKELQILRNSVGQVDIFLEPTGLMISGGGLDLAIGP